MIPFYQIGIGERFERMLELVKERNTYYTDCYCPITTVPVDWQGSLHLNWYKVFHLKHILSNLLFLKRTGFIGLFDSDVLLCRRLRESEIEPIFINPETCFAMTPTVRGGRNAGGMFVRICQRSRELVEETIRQGLATEEYSKEKPFAEQALYDKILTGMTCVNLPVTFNHYRNAVGFPIDNPVIRSWHGYDYDFTMEAIRRELERNRFP